MRHANRHVENGDQIAEASAEYKSLNRRTGISRCQDASANIYEVRKTKTLGNQSLGDLRIAFTPPHS